MTCNAKKTQSRRFQSIKGPGVELEKRIDLNKGSVTILRNVCSALHRPQS